jgi:hypothetical protein
VTSLRQRVAAGGRSAERAVKRVYVVGTADTKEELRQNRRLHKLDLDERRTRRGDDDNSDTRRLCPI